MKIKYLLFCVLLSFVVVSCRKDKDTITSIDGSTTTTTTTNTGGGTTSTTTGYSITETFENGSKTAYAAADVTLSTGSWNFNDALIGNLAGDAKNGSWSTRIRAGAITTNFNISGLTKVVVKHAKYGSDPSSTWQLLISKDNGVTFTQVGTDITEDNTALKTDSFAIVTTVPVRVQIKRTGTSASTNRINIDDVTFKGTGLPGVTVVVTDTPPADTSNTTGSTTPRTNTPGSDTPPASGDNSNMLFGNPSNATVSTATGDNYLIDQGYYAESYSASRAEPNWVSWHLDATNTTNATGRLDNFAAFAGLPPGFYQVQSNSYSGSGFDRGHNCPSADRTSSVAANSATFLMTNMIPQAPQNNQQTWANLENYLRNQVVAGNEVYIIMGSYGSGGVGSLSTATVTTINNGHINVPSNVWKVAVILPKGDGDLARVTSTTRVIAVNTPNINSINSDWTKYIVTVRDIETATGYNLLSALSQSVQDAVEVKKDPGN